MSKGTTSEITCDGCPVNRDGAGRGKNRVWPLSMITSNARLKRMAAATYM
jgi:hypothetical protein